VAAKIQSSIHDAQVLTNKVPKVWVDYEIYCQLVPNSDPNEKAYMMIPRTGAFEVSFKGVVSFISIAKSTLPSLVDLL
jgi:hypothetical protein